MVKYKLNFILFLIIFMTFINPASAWWNNSKYNMSNMPLPNGMRPYVMIYNVSNTSGISNTTHIFFNGNVNKNFSGINVTDSNLTEENYTIIPKNDGSGEYWLAINWSKNGSKQIYYNETNLGIEVGNASNPNTTFTQASGRMTSDYKMTNVTGNSMTANWQYWAKINHSSNPQSQWGISSTPTWQPYDGALLYMSNNVFVEVEAFNSGVYTFSGVSGAQAGMSNFKMHKNNTMISYFINDTLLGTLSSGLPSVPMGLTQMSSSATSTQEFAFLMPYVEPEPISGVWGIAESQPLNIFPATPINIIAITYNFGVNTSWDKGMGGAITDSYNISFNNGTFKNGSIPSFVNNTLLAHGYQNITVWAWNNSGLGNLSTGSITLNISVPNNIPTIPIISVPVNNSLQYNSSITLNYSSSDLDNDSIRFTIQYANDSAFTTNLTSVNTSSTIYTFATTINQSYYIRINASDNYSSSGWGLTITFREAWHPLQLISPANGSTSISPSAILTWGDYPTTTESYQIATDSQFINVVGSGTGVINNDVMTVALSLSPNTQYFWHAKNSTSNYTTTWNFTTSAPAVTPGSLNITILDEVNLTIISNFTIQLYNTTAYISQSTTTGWVNLTASQISSGQYLAIAIPNSSYYQRMVLVTSPTNVTMYLPSVNGNIIVLVSFSLLDVTGLYPFASSVITTIKGGLTVDKSYFSADGTHPVYFISGSSYQIQIQNGNNIFVGGNFVPLTTGTSQIVINNFAVNASSINPFAYNITYNVNQILLNWNDTGGVLSSLNFTVYKGVPLVQISQLITPITHGQSIVMIDNSTQYSVVFSALMKDGTYLNDSFVIDYRYGIRRSSTGTSPITGAPIGIGYIWDSGTWHTPAWIYNWFSLILIILLAGTFGGYYGIFGAVVTLIVALILEGGGLFRPLGNSDPNNIITMGITGGMFFIAVIYYLQHIEKGGV